MVDDSLTRRIEYEYPIFESYLQPHGALTIDPACHACFYYGMLAAKALQVQGSGIESQVIVYKVGETPAPWFEANLAQLAKSVATLYALENPDVFLKFKREAWVQAQMLGVVIPEHVFNPPVGLRIN